MLSKTNLEILVKIVYAVETGGQIYGQCRYDDFTEAYTNSKAETAITIGAGQWFAGEAKTLLRKLKRKILILSKSWILRERLWQILRVQIGVSTS